MEELPTKRLKGYVKTKIVGTRYHYKNSDGQCLPHPMPGCHVSLQLEPSNPYDCNAIKVISEEDKRHLGYIPRETANALSPLLKDNTFASARGIISVQYPYQSIEVIPCQVLLFFAGRPELIPPLPSQLDFNEDLSNPHFMLTGSPVAFIGCTLNNYDSFVAHSEDPLPLQLLDDEPLLHPCSTNICSPICVDSGDSTALFDLPPNLQTQSKTQTRVETRSEVQVTTQENEVTCMKCKQTGGGPFFQCIQSRCPLLIHESCIIGVVDRTCLFCLFLAHREEILGAKKGSDLYVILKAKYEKARKSAIRFFGKDTFMSLRELAGLKPLLPTPVQVPCTGNMQCHTEDGRAEEPAGTSTVIDKSGAKEKGGLMDATNIMLTGSPVASNSCTLNNCESFVAHSKDPLPRQPPLEEPLLHPCSTNTHSLILVDGGDSTASLDLPSKFQTQSQTQTQVETISEIRGTVQKNEVTCMKCKQTGGGPFFQCIQTRCPLLIHESCIVGVVGHTCLFCQFLACRGEILGAKDGSDLYVILKAQYENARKSAIRFFGKDAFMSLREHAGLKPLLPTPVQVPCTVNMQCDIDETRVAELVGTSTIVEKHGGKEKKEVKDAANIMLTGSPAAFISCTLNKCDSFVPHSKDPLPLQPPLEEPLLHPCSTNTHSPILVDGGGSTASLDLPPKFQTQSKTQSQVETISEIRGTVQKNEVTCMKCKQTGGGPFFQCIQNKCPLLIHESCIIGVVGRTCLFCQFLARREEILGAKNGSDLYVTLREKYEKARKSAIRFFGKDTFVSLRELAAGLKPILPTPMQVPRIVSMQGHIDKKRAEELVGTSTIINKGGAKEKKGLKVAANIILEGKKVVARGKRRLPPRPRLDRACKTRIQALQPTRHSNIGSVN